MRNAIRETDRRRAIQVAYNEEHGITPRDDHQGHLRHLRLPRDRVEGARGGRSRRRKREEGMSAEEIRETMVELEEEMLARGRRPALRVRGQAARRDQVTAARAGRGRGRGHVTEMQKVFALRTQLCRMQGVSRALREVVALVAVAMLLLAAASTANAAKAGDITLNGTRMLTGEKSTVTTTKLPNGAKRLKYEIGPFKIIPGQNEIGYTPITRQAAGRRLHHADAARPHLHERHGAARGRRPPPPRGVGQPQPPERHQQPPRAVLRGRRGEDDLPAAEGLRLPLRGVGQLAASTT